METIRPKEIKPLEIVQALLLTDEDVEESTFARVMKNDTVENRLKVLFMLDNGCLDRQVTNVPYECLVAHWPGETNIWDVSGIEPMSDEDEDEDETLGGFIVPDDEEDNPEYTDERRHMNRRWDNWDPDSDEGRRYKNMVNRIEDKYC